MLVRWLAAAAAVLAFLTTTIPGVAQAQAATGSPASAQNLSANPVLAAGTAGWKIVSGGTSLRRVPITDHLVATRAAQVTSTSTTTRLGEPREAVTAGRTFSFASDVKAARAGALASVSVSWFSTGGEFLGYDEGRFVPVGNAAWTRTFVSAVAPKRSAFGRSQVNVINTARNASITVTQHDVRAGNSTPPGTAPPATGPAPAPAAPVSAAPVFTGDFETGNLGQYQLCQTRSFNGACGAIPPGYSIGVEPGRRGGFAARLEVRDGDQPFCCGERAQLVAYGTRETEGKDYRYDWSFMIDQQFPISNSWQTILEWHSEVDGSPPLSFNTEGTNLVLQTRPRPNAPYTGVTNIWSTPFVKGRWMDITLHVRWSSDPSVGLAEITKNGVRQTFTATPPENGNGTPCTGQQTCRFRNIYPGDRGNRAMVTYYRDAAINGTGVVHVDRFDVSTP